MIVSLDYNFIINQLWLRLAESKLTGHKWAHIAKFAFNEKSNRDDDKLGLQIVKVIICYNILISCIRFRYLTLYIIM